MESQTLMMHPCVPALRIKATRANAKGRLRSIVAHMLQTAAKKKGVEERVSLSVSFLGEDSGAKRDMRSCICDCVQPASRTQPQSC